MFFGHDSEHSAVLIRRQPNNDIDQDTNKNILLMSTGSAVVVQHE